MKMQYRQIETGAYQQGVATLLVSLVVLTTITFISLYTARTVMVEQKISTNEYRSRMAFEAAETGAEFAIAYIIDGRDRDSDGQLPGSDADEFLFDTDADGTTDSNTMTLPNGSSVAVSMQNADDGDLTATEITAQGWSDDGTATRTVTQTVAVVSPLPNAPENPLTTRGTVVINGSATVHNPEGNSTIWSGGDVDLGANNSTSTEVADPNDIDYPDCLGQPLDPCDLIQASDRYVASLDIIEYDSSLSNLSNSDFFTNFFGVSPEVYRETRATMDIDIAAGDSIDQIHLATNEYIWVDGNLNVNGKTVGCSQAMTGSSLCPQANWGPSILIVDGDLNLSGGPHFYGLVFVTGNVNINGNATFQGAIVTQGDTTNTTGSLDVWYNSALLDLIAQGGRPAGGGGSWRDF